MVQHLIVCVWVLCRQAILVVFVRQVQVAADLRWHAQERALQNQAEVSVQVGLRMRSGIRYIR